MAFSVTAVVLAAGVVGSGGEAWSARLLDGALVPVAQAHSDTPPPLLDPPTDETHPPFAPSPWPAPPRNEEDVVEAPVARAVNIPEIAAVGLSVLVLDVGTFALGFGFGVMALIGLMGNGPLFVVGALGSLFAFIANVVGTPLIAGMVARVVGGPSFKNTDRTRAMLYAAAVHGPLLVFLLPLSAVWAVSILTEGRGEGFGLLTLVTLGVLAVRSVGIGLSASYGLRQRSTGRARPRRDPGRSATTPSEHALATRLGLGVPLLAFSF